MARQGRPRRFDRLIEIRLTHAQHFALTEQAAALDTSVAALLRGLVDEHVMTTYERRLRRSR
jgi:hypothetical protein